jgi:hypothetical protein
MKRKRKRKKKEGKKEKEKEKKKRKKRRVPRRAISTGHRVQEHNPQCYKRARIGEESKLSPLLYEPLWACSNGISQNQQRVRANMHECAFIIQSNGLGRQAAKGAGQHAGNEKYKSWCLVDGAAGRQQKEQKLGLGGPVYVTRDVEL